MADKVIDKAWSYIQAGDFVRWATPRFIKYGHVKKVNGQSMIVSFLDSLKPTVIPDAKWYFVRGKENPEAEEHLVCIDYAAWWNVDDREADQQLIVTAASVNTMSVDDACEMLNWDAKKVRRYIRRGHIVAAKKDDRWVIDGERLKEQAARQGWL